MAISEGHGLRKESYPERAERIERELTEIIERIHSGIDSVPLAHIHEALEAEKSKDGEKGIHKQIERLSKDTVQFAELFRSIPPNYYLELEVAHSAYSEDANYPFARKARVGNTLRYYIDCGVWLNSGQGRSVVALREQIPSIGLRYPLPYFILKQTGTGMIGDRYLRLGEIQNAKVVRNPNAFTPLISPHTPFK